MSDAETRKLFAMVDSLNKAVGALKVQVETALGELEGISKASRVAVSNTNLVLQGYQEHGTLLEHLRLRMERLNVRCPLMKPDTAELPKVG